MSVLENKIDITKKLRAEVVKAILLNETNINIIESGIENVSDVGVHYYNIVKVNDNFYRLKTFKAHLSSEISYYAQIPTPVIPVHTIKYIGKEDLP